MSNELEESLKSLQIKIAPFVHVIQEATQKIGPIIQKIAIVSDGFLREYSPAIIKFAETVGTISLEFAKKAQEWQKVQKVNVIYLAEMGWFPNWGTFFYYPSEEHKTADDLMISQIDEDWDDLKVKILELSPNRKPILEVAFKLHEEGNYIASIPLFLSQADGICSEEFTHFFSKDSTTGNRASDEIIKQAENSEIVTNFLSGILLEPFKVDLQISKGSSRASKAAKAKGPNRHGIIHGSRKHLDYGTKINGYKAFSFLAFIIFSVKDEFKKS